VATTPYTGVNGKSGLVVYIFKKAGQGSALLFENVTMIG
jgi:hypothetical protein